MDSTEQAPRTHSPLRILEVCSARTLGGGEVHVIQLVEELRRSAHHVEVAGRTGGPLELDHELGFANSLDLASAVRLRRIVRKGRFDIVHAHIARDYPISAAALTGLPAPKLVLTRQLIHRVKRNPLYGRVDAWIATTPQIERSLQHLNPPILKIIPNWIDKTNFDYRERPLHDPVVLGILGQVSPHKGHDDAIDMIKGLGTGFRLVVGGTGRDAYVNALRERARSLPVEFRGFVRAAEFLDDIDVLILPSWEEPFGIVVLEAMAAGVNVIATNAGGPPEILDFGTAGVLVPPHNPRALETAVRELVADSARANELRRLARHRAASRYDISLVVPEIEKLFRELRAGG